MVIRSCNLCYLKNPDDGADIELLLRTGEASPNILDSNQIALNAIPRVLDHFFFFVNVTVNGILDYWYLWRPINVIITAFQIHRMLQILCHWIEFSLNFLSAQLNYTRRLMLSHHTKNNFKVYNVASHFSPIEYINISHSITN